MKKLPYGISNYEELVEGDYYYVDKTQYIEKLENLAEKRIIFLRPRKFGKTLFTSVLENYYDVKKKEKFETLFQNTYIGKNPTKLKNSYYILRFNFSGIDTSSNTIDSFKRRTVSAINYFVENYKLEFTIDKQDEAENILDNLFKSFKLQKTGKKIYVIIDEYDHFANELLGFKTAEFKNLVTRNGKVRKWYEILKEGGESVVDRIFITGVAPITLDSLTSGFNIGADITKDRDFNEMMGFTKQELIYLMNENNITFDEQQSLLPVMKENYDGYKFSIKGKEKIYNSNMCLYFLNEYIRHKEFPQSLIDVNIASDYSKLGKMLDLCKGENRENIIQKTILGEKIVSEIIEKFNPEITFKETELISMLYYLGYLTIVGEEFGIPELLVPNKVMKDIYSKYFFEVLSKEAEFEIGKDDDRTIRKEIFLEGKIDKIAEILQKYINNLSNRDFIGFSEKYIKIMFYCIIMNLKTFTVKSEMEVQRKYPDLVIMPNEKEREKGYASIMIEFKYLKKGEENKLEEKQKEAREQILGYAELEEINSLEKLNLYTIVAVNDKLYVEKV